MFVIDSAGRAGEAGRCPGYEVPGLQNSVEGLGCGLERVAWFAVQQEFQFGHSQ